MLNKMTGTRWIENKKNEVVLDEVYERIYLRIMTSTIMKRKKSLNGHLLWHNAFIGIIM